MGECLEERVVAMFSMIKTAAQCHDVSIIVVLAATPLALSWRKLISASFLNDVSFRLGHDAELGSRSKGTNVYVTRHALQNLREELDEVGE